MIQMSLLEQIIHLVEMIVSSPLTIFLLFIVCGFITLLIVEIKSKEKMISKIIAYGFIISTIIVAMIFSKPLYMLSDSFMNNVFQTLLFPNVVVYILIIITINLSLIALLFKEKINSKYLIPTFIAAIQIDFLGILTLNTINKNNIDIYSEITMYSDKDLLVLLQFTTEIFVLWVIVMTLIIAINKLITIKNKELKKQNLVHIKNLIIRRKNNFQINKKEKLIRKEIIDFVEEEEQV
jgi:hypothetical protein